MSSFRESLEFLEIGRDWYLPAEPIVKTSEIENEKLHRLCHYVYQEYAQRGCIYCVARLGVLDGAVSP